MNEIIENTQIGTTQTVEEASKDVIASPLGILDRIIQIADKGFKLTFDEEKNRNFEYEDKKIEELNILFSEILNLSNMELKPMLDDKKLTEQDKDLMDALQGLILNCANLAVVKLEGREEFKKLKQLFGEILINADTELADALKEYSI